MPLPDVAQCMALGLLDELPAGHCAACGQRPAAYGFLMCHECRAACGLTSQDSLFDPEPTYPTRRHGGRCLFCGSDIPKGNRTGACVPCGNVISWAKRHGLPEIVATEVLKELGAVGVEAMRARCAAKKHEGSSRLSALLPVTEVVGR